MGSTRRQATPDQHVDLKGVISLIVALAWTER
jgi:hypothetical protein